MEHQVEAAYLDNLSKRCHLEKAHRSRLASRWSSREQARTMKLPKVWETRTHTPLPSWHLCFVNMVFLLP